MKKDGFLHFRLNEGLAIVISIYHILQITGILNQIGIYILPQPFRASSFGLISILIFLWYPAGSKSPGANRVFDILLILVTVLSCGYYTFFYESVIWPHSLDAYASSVDIAAGIAVIFIAFETCRRTIGWPMVIAALLFVVHALAGCYFPGPFHGRCYTVQRLIYEIFIGQNGIWGVALGVASTVVIVFILFGSFVKTFGAGIFFNDVAFSTLGRFRGGAAKGAILSSCLFGSINDSTAANVATTGCITIPLMKKMGFKPHFAGAVEAVAANGGQIMPPVMGVVAFIMAEFIGVPYGKICVAAFVPALLYYIGLYVMVDFESVKLGIFGLPKEKLPSFSAALKDGWYHIMPILGLVVFLVFLGYTPAKSGLLALGVLIVTCFLAKRSRFEPRLIAESLSGIKGIAMVMPACAAAGIIIGSLGTTGLGLRLSSILVELAGGSMLMLLLLTALSSFILGMGLTSIPCYIILAVLVAPALEKMGASAMSAHLFVFYFGIISFITPPVAIAAFVAAGIAESSAWKTGWTATRLALVTFIVPFAFMYDNGLLLQGSVLQIAVACITAIVGSVCIAAGQPTYPFLMGRLRTIQAVLIFVGGIFLIFSGWHNIIGAALVLSGLGLKFFFEQSPSAVKEGECEEEVKAAAFASGKD